MNSHTTARPVFDFSKDPGYYNADAKRALLRRGKRPPHDELAVDFSAQAVRISLRAAGRLVVDGEWEWTAALEGTQLTAEGDWKEVAWHRETSCDYLEIELPLAGGFKLERQLFFARKELFFFVADCLIGPPNADGQLRYGQKLPLADGSSFLATDETCEGWLSVAGKRAACVVPLAQPEWRSDFRHARMTLVDNQLSTEVTAAGPRILSPLWIDIHQARIRRPITWRQLTVGENLGPVPRNAAVGYRVQAGDEQWIVYRSLARVANRSVLGHNTYGSFVCGKIKPDGNVKEILTME